MGWSSYGRNPIRLLPNLGSLGPLFGSPFSIDLTHRAPLLPTWTPHQDEYLLKCQNFLGPKNSDSDNLPGRVFKGVEGTEQTHSPGNPPNSMTQEKKNPLSPQGVHPSHSQALWVVSRRHSSADQASPKSGSVSLL